MRQGNSAAALLRLKNLARTEPGVSQERSRGQRLRARWEQGAEADALYCDPAGLARTGKPACSLYPQVIFTQEMLLSLLYTDRSFVQ